MTIRALLALIRPPNVFTAVADSLAGLVVLWALGLSVSDRSCAVVLVSACLYLSGIVLNDVFDHRRDATERPTRPIPNGAVHLGEAALLGAGLMAAGLAIAGWIGRDVLAVALLLAASILLYDGGLKHTRLGPLVMGACRGLDMAMGLATGLPLAQGWPSIALAGPLVLGLYVAGLTYIARDEVDGNTARRARTGVVFLAALAVAVVFVLVASSRFPTTWWAWSWVVLLLWLGWRNWSPLWHRHDGPATGRAIGGGILLIPVLDATFCAVAGCPVWALAVALLAVPALILKQFYSPT